ncbi:MAG: RluA family pseudouridine synthase [Candidatus Hydrogenedentes bacterium]|nr:RluA family pseudouridine synthase [Candidatus Hydrogenedentota bacterium]
MTITFEEIVDESGERLRLDVYLTERIEDASRSFIKKLIKDERVSVNGGVCTRPGRSMTAGDKVCVEIPPPPDTRPAAEDIPLDILYQDDDVLVVNKPQGLCVHPAPGNYTGTLVNAVLFHCPDFESPGADLGRPGIVHRLDMHTSGALVVAKTQRAFNGLAKQARDHTFDRRYLALVRGEFPEDSGRINATVGRSLSDRTKMSVTGVHGREAVTRFEVLERFGVASLVALILETGRTHQIRVHLRFAQHPVLGDPVYGVTDFRSWAVSDEVRAALDALRGQALHAERLGFEHPVSGKQMTFTAAPPADFQRALDALRTV